MLNSKLRRCLISRAALLAATEDDGPEDAIECAEDTRSDEEASAHRSCGHSGLLPRLQPLNPVESSFSAPRSHQLVLP